MSTPRPRVRIRYRKQSDLRLVGHQDFIHAWDRLLRRADVRPAMSEGFHHRPRYNFPSALAVGIGGTDEVMELELQYDTEPADLRAKLEAHAPAGLSIASIERLPGGTRFSQPSGASYEVSLPAERLEEIRARVEARPVESWHPSVRELTVVDGVMRMFLQLGVAGALRPRDVLAQLDLADLESQGAQITRTRVELAA